ncbi:hypothetical protein [Streptomyces microflavus]|uniref:hypothetical protein n=1 Tax=Streptomyces microflavus TaxID=1919 RepID=UPI0036E1E4DA
MLTSVTRALVDTGSTDDARHLLTCVPDTRHTFLGRDVRDGAYTVIAADHRSPVEHPSGEALAEQACHLAQHNRHEEASRQLLQALESLEASPHAARPHETWLITLRRALAAIGHHADGAHLARSLHDPAHRVQALAGAAVAAVAAEHLSDGRRLADEAANRTRTLEGAGNLSVRDGTPGRDVSDAGADAQALAYAGEAPEPVPSCRTPTARAATGANARSSPWRPGCAPTPRPPQPTSSATSGNCSWPAPPRGGPGGRIADLAELLTAPQDTDAACAERLRDAAERTWEQLKDTRTPLDAEDTLVLLLLNTPGQREQAGQTLTGWEESRTNVPPWELPTAAVAVAHAAFGDLDAARRCANGLNVPHGRSAAFADVASYLTGAPVALGSVSETTSTAFARTFRPGSGVGSSPHRSWSGGR